MRSFGIIFTCGLMHIRCSYEYLQQEMMYVHVHCNEGTAWLNDAFFIIFGQQWSSRGNKIHQTLVIQIICISRNNSNNNCWFWHFYGTLFKARKLVYIISLMLLSINTIQYKSADERDKCETT